MCRSEIEGVKYRTHVDFLYVFHRFCAAAAAFVKEGKRFKGGFRGALFLFLCLLLARDCCLLGQIYTHREGFRNGEQSACFISP